MVPPPYDVDLVNLDNDTHVKSQELWQDSATCILVLRRPG